MAKSNLDLVDDCDRWILPSELRIQVLSKLSSFPYYQSDSAAYFTSISAYYQLRVANHDYAVGHVLSSVAEIFRGLNDWAIDDDERTLTLTAGATEAERSHVVMRTVVAMRETKHFQVLQKWRNELYPVYGRNRELLFNVERCASPLLGVVTYAVHMTAFVRLKDGSMKIWIPRRARNKQTYGGMLDNTVAGGIASGEVPFEGLVRECEEEASLPEALVRERARACGTVTYCYIRDERAGGETRLLQPECQYVYDLELPGDVVPKPCDGEVEEFYLWSIKEVQEAMSKAEFKPNCALVMLDFFIRHGILTSENEKDYIESWDSQLSDLL